MRNKLDCAKREYCEFPRFVGLVNYSVDKVMFKRLFGKPVEIKPKNTASAAEDAKEASLENSTKAMAKIRENMETLQQK